MSDLTEALQTLEECNPAIKGDYLGLSAEWRPIALDALTYRGVLFADFGVPEQALACFTRAIEIDPNVNVVNYFNRAEVCAMVSRRSHPHLLSLTHNPVGAVDARAVCCNDAAVGL